MVGASRGVVIGWFPMDDSFGESGSKTSGGRAAAHGPAFVLSVYPGQALRARFFSSSAAQM